MRRQTVIALDRRVRAVLVAGLLAVVIVAWVRPADTTRRAGPSDADDIVVLNDNGAWSWFQDERAVVDEASGVVLVSSVANAAGSGGHARHGNVEVSSFDLLTGAIQRSVLHQHLEADDHDAAALRVGPDGRYLAMYSRHLTDNLTRWRVGRGPGEMVWEAERTVVHGDNVTYANVFPAQSRDDRQVLLAFVRGEGFDPNILVSTDGGASWRPDGRLLDGVGRPYLKFAGDGAGRVHFVTTEQHPQQFPNGVYHGVIDHGQLQRSDGTVVDPDVHDGDALRPEQLDVVYPAGHGRAWTIDVHVDAMGHPYATFSVRGTRIPAAGQRSCRGACYYYARFDGSAWRVQFLAEAGSALTPTQPYYTGLVALHPHDPNRAFISTDIDPTTGAPLVSSSDGLQHHEIFAGTTSDGGATWTWNAVTANSSVDNIRPIVPIWDDQHTVVLWLRGTYRGYTDYDLDVVATFMDQP